MLFSTKTNNNQAKRMQTDREKEERWAKGRAKREKKREKEREGGEKTRDTERRRWIAVYNIGRIVSAGYLFGLFVILENQFSVWIVAEYG